MHGNTCPLCPTERQQLRTRVVHDQLQLSAGKFCAISVAILLLGGMLSLVLGMMKFQHHTLVAIISMVLCVGMCGWIFWLGNKKYAEFLANRHAVHINIELDGEPHLHLNYVHHDPQRGFLMDDTNYEALPLTIRLGTNVLPTPATLLRNHPTPPANSQQNWTNRTDVGTGWKIMIVDPFNRIEFTDQHGQCLAWWANGPYTLPQILRIVEQTKSVSEALGALISTTENYHSTLARLLALSQLLYDMKPRRHMKEFGIIRQIIDQVIRKSGDTPLSEIEELTARFKTEYSEEYRIGNEPTPASVRTEVRAEGEMARSI